MPDVHVDSMVVQYPFFYVLFLVYVSLYFCSHFTFDNLLKVSCIFLVL